MLAIDFGIYHHSTAKQSEELRKIAKIMFYEAFDKLSIPKQRKIEILDVGAGSGFLTYITALYFPNSHITAVDTFTGQSLEGNSINRMNKNMEASGIFDRVSIIQSDIRDINSINGSFDLAVSNLVLHNLSHHKYSAYRNIKQVIKCSGYFLNADGFIRKNVLVEPFKKDMSKISSLFDAEFAMEPKNQKKSDAWRYILVGLRPICGQA
ncbi:MAG: class I SAM-dependent methyltransferase [Ferroplasma sp.]